MVFYLTRFLNWSFKNFGMKKLICCVCLATLFVLLIFLSCKKELSCEGCRENNRPPIAIAGPDRVITLPANSISLDGSSSSDPDGTISDWLWKKISGPASFNMIEPSDSITLVKDLTAGTYQFELKVTDSGGLSSKDTIQIIVDAVVITNHPPVANAGPDQTIILPTNTVTLDGSASSDPDNNITDYTWKKISGPSASFSIDNARAVQTQITNLITGIYQFELMVMDAGGLASGDTVLINVGSLTNGSCPPANRPFINVQLTPLGTLSIPRSSSSNILSGTKMLFAGGSVPAGLGGHSLSTRIDIYDFSTQNWSTAELSQARIGMTTAAAGNKILFAGGEMLPGVTKSNRVDIYDFLTNTWSTAGLSFARSGMKAAVLGNKIFFADGEIPGSVIPTRVDIYDASTNTWSTTELSEPRGGIAIGTLGNKVFFAGGYSKSGLSSRIDVYDNSNNSWTTATLSEARSFITATTAENKIFFAGGYNVDAVSSAVDVYDNGTGSWSASYLTEPKLNMYNIFKNGKIFWAGGEYSHDHNNNEPVYTCQVEIKDINTLSSSVAYLAYPWIGSGGRTVCINNKIGFLRAENFDIYDQSANSWSVGIWPHGVVAESLISSASVLNTSNAFYIAGSVDRIGHSFPDKVWKVEF